MSNEVYLPILPLLFSADEKLLALYFDWTLLFQLMSDACFYSHCSIIVITISIHPHKHAGTWTLQFLLRKTRISYPSPPTILLSNSL